MTLQVIEILKFKKLKISKHNINSLQMLIPCSLLFSASFLEFSNYDFRKMNDIPNVNLF